LICHSANLLSLIRLNLSQYDRGYLLLSSAGDTKFIKEQRLLREETIELFEKQTINVIEELPNQFKDKKESQIYEALLATKENVDDIVLRNSQIIKNEDFFAQDIMQKIIINFMDTYKLIKEEDEKAYEGVQNISNLIISEYKQGWQSWR